MLPTKCFMMDKVFSRVVNFTLNSMAYLNQFSLALSGHPGSGTAFYVEKPVQRMMYSFVPDLSWPHTHTQSSNTYLRHQSRLKKSSEHQKIHFRSSDNKRTPSKSSRY
ncbi:hypothetical protein Tco_1021563 [Tanacetum coccineum]